MSLKYRFLMNFPDEPEKRVILYYGKCFTMECKNAFSKYVSEERKCDGTAILLLLSTHFKDFIKVIYL